MRIGKTAVASKYKGRADAVNSLSGKIRAGGFEFFVPK
jgi:hypothetical protein